VKLVITFKQKVSIKKFYIKNGYGDYRHYAANNCVRMLRMTGNQKTIFSVLLDDNPGYQKVRFPDTIETDSLILQIQDVYPGEKYNDTCLTHITFNEWNDLDHAAESRCCRPTGDSRFNPRRP
jgi:hypothetical protein